MVQLSSKILAALARLLSSTQPQATLSRQTWPLPVKVLIKEGSEIFQKPLDLVLVEAIAFYVKQYRPCSEHPRKLTYQRQLKSDSQGKSWN